MCAVTATQTRHAAEFDADGHRLPVDRRVWTELTHAEQQLAADLFGPGWMAVVTRNWQRHDALEAEGA